MEFGKYRKKFKLRDIVGRFIDIYKIRNRYSEEDKATIKNQIEEKLNVLIKEGIL